MDSSATIDPTSSTATTAVGVIETDLFCAACGFNLHTQRVWRDQRLNILVCRCPECGQHQPAAERTTAANAWLRRVALLGVLAWAALAIAFTLGTFGLALGIHAAADEGLTYRNYETRDGRSLDIVYNTASGAGAVSQQYGLATPTGTGANVPIEDVVLRRRLVPWLGGRSPTPYGVGQFYYGRPNDVLPACLIAALLAAAWYACAVVLSAASWFYRPGRCWAWLLLPVLATLTVYLLMNGNERQARRYAGVVPAVDDVAASALFFAVAATLVALMAFGLSTGRAVARLLLSVFVPPRARQLLAFLWHCDGKAMPSPRRPLTDPAAPP